MILTCLLVPSHCVSELASIKWSNIKFLDFFKFSIGSEDSLVTLGMNTDTNNYILTFFSYVTNGLKETFSAGTSGYKNIVALNVTNQNCFGLFEKNHKTFSMKCVALTPENTLTVLNDQNVITTEIRNAVGGASNWLVLHHVDNEISSWEYGESTGWILKETFKALHMVQDVAAVVFRGQRYIAVCSQAKLASKSGYIDVYR